MCICLILFLVFVLEILKEAEEIKNELIKTDNYGDISKIRISRMNRKSESS